MSDISNKNEFLSECVHLNIRDNTGSCVHRVSALYIFYTLLHGRPNGSVLIIYPDIFGTHI